MLRLALSEEKNIVQELWNQDSNSAFSNYYFGNTNSNGVLEVDDL